MPIYEYRCESCGHELDALQKINDPPLTVCPACADGTLRRLVSAPRFRLKGSGWYETDFKQDRQRNLADGGGGEKPAADKADASANGSAAGGESKTAAKGEAKAAGGDSGGTASGEAARSGKAGGKETGKTGKTGKTAGKASGGSGAVA